MKAQASRPGNAKESKKPEEEASQEKRSGRNGWQGKHSAQPRRVLAVIMKAERCGRRKGDVAKKKQKRDKEQLRGGGAGKESEGKTQRRACKNAPVQKKSNRRSCGEYAVKNVDREDLSTVSGMKNADCIQINTIFGHKRRFVIFL